MRFSVYYFASTTARVPDYGCQREQQAVLSNQHGRLLDQPPCPRVILLLAEIHSKNNTRVGRPRWNTRCAIPSHLDSLRNLPRIPSTNSYRLCITFRIYRIILSYYVFISATNHVNLIILRFLRLLEVVGISRSFLFSITRWILFITRKNFRRVVRYCP